MEATISVYLDTRRAKKDVDTKKPSQSADAPQRKPAKIYPLKLRIYFNKETRYYPTGFDLTEDDFERSYKAEKPRGEFRDLKVKIAGIEARAHEIRKALKVFSFDKFERKLLRKAGAGTDIFFHLEEIAKQFRQAGQINTALQYERPVTVLKEFLKHKGKKSSILSLDDITPSFLKEFERWLLINGRNVTTVGYYMRPIGTAFRKAIKEGEIDAEYNPLGRIEDGKYTIPPPRNEKKSLTKEDIKKLFTYEVPEDSHMARARAFWFFSFFSNGMNLKDVAELKYKNINGNGFTFIRSKTKRRTKGEPMLIKVVLNDYTRSIIERYGNANIGGDTYVFPVFYSGITEEQKVVEVKAFTGYVNGHFTKLANLAGIEGSCSSYVARHSFTTISVRNGASLEMLQMALGHKHLTTTQNYWKGFDDSVIEEINKGLTDFLK